MSGFEIELQWSFNNFGWILFSSHRGSQEQPIGHCLKEFYSPEQPNVDTNTITKDAVALPKLGQTSLKNLSICPMYHASIMQSPFVFGPVIRDSLSNLFDAPVTPLFVKKSRCPTDIHFNLHSLGRYATGASISTRSAFLNGVTQEAEPRAHCMLHVPIRKGLS